ncbi:MAG TPA: hypothetical protein PLK76_01980 [bacterium]|nr:hypothetical protein [bacterium]
MKPSNIFYRITDNKVINIFFELLFVFSIIYFGFGRFLSSVLKILKDSQPFFDFKEIFLFLFVLSVCLYFLVKDVRSLSFFQSKKRNKQ